MVWLQAKYHNVKSCYIQNDKVLHFTFVYGENKPCYIQNNKVLHFTFMYGEDNGHLHKMPSPMLNMYTAKLQFCLLWLFHFTFRISKSWKTQFNLTWKPFCSSSHFKGLWCYSWKKKTLLTHIKQEKCLFHFQNLPPWSWFREKVKRKKWYEHVWKLFSCRIPKKCDSKCYHSFCTASKCMFSPWKKCLGHLHSVSTI